MTAEKKLWLIEGIPGSGKSTAARKLGQTLHAQAYNEAELHPCDLAWHAVLSRAELDAFIARHPDKERAICENSAVCGEQMLLAYAQLGLDGEEFARMEAREAFNGRYAPEELMTLMEARWRGFAQHMTGRHVFECAFMQNPVGELMLFDDLPEEEIRKMQLRLAGCLAGCDVKLGYLRVPSVRATLESARAERVDDKGNPVLAEGVSQIIAQSPYGRAHGLSGWEGMVRFYETRQALELRLVRAMPFPTVIADASDHERAQRELAAFFGEA